MNEYIKANKKWWNAAAPIHANSPLYDLKSFTQGKTSLQSIELEEVGDVKGKELLHLMCHFGMDTLSWARLGAQVTGIDVSDQAISRAKKLSDEINTPATFLCCDIYELPRVLDRKFDIVFTSYGVLMWLSSLEKWAEVIYHFLKKGGVFYIVEIHPFTNILSHDFKIHYDYFDKGPYEDNSMGTYTNWNANIQGTTYEWHYTMSDIINALLQKGLHIDYIHEFAFTIYDQFAGYMKQNAKGQYILRSKNAQIPLLFSLKATK